MVRRGWRLGKLQSIILYRFGAIDKLIKKKTENMFIR